MKKSLVQLYERRCIVVEYNIAYIPGDGIGTEIIAETIKVIKEVGSFKVVPMSRTFKKRELRS